MILFFSFVYFSFDFHVFALARNWAKEYPLHTKRVIFTFTSLNSICFRFCRSSKNKSFVLIHSKNFRSLIRRCIFVVVVSLLCYKMFTFFCCRLCWFMRFISFVKTTRANDERTHTFTSIESTCFSRAFTFCQCTRKMLITMKFCFDLLNLVSTDTFTGNQTARRVSHPTELMLSRASSVNCAYSVKRYFWQTWFYGVWI